MKKEIKLSDYIIEFLISKNVTDAFGYPGGMVAHLIDSFSKYKDKINNHINYHEQASSFAACGYAQSGNVPGVAYATSGPGATNLITGICNAYYDSIPVIFITGQPNSKELKKNNVRQNGFQETNIIEIVKPITKYTKQVLNKDDIIDVLEEAYQIAISGRPGPVLIDIPTNVFDSMIEIREPNTKKKAKEKEIDIDYIINLINLSNKPCIIYGNGIKTSNLKSEAKAFAKEVDIPILSSMLAVDIISSNHPNNYGFIGAYGSRTANFIAAKSDLVLVLGSRLSLRQIGAMKENFAPNAKIVRIDIDQEELNNIVSDRQISIKGDLKDFFSKVLKNVDKIKNFQEWKCTCNEIREKLKDIDNSKEKKLISKLSEYIDNDTSIVTDVGQNQVWVAQSFLFKDNQNCLFSGGHGAMGYSLPASIGAYYKTKKPVLSINGDGGFQMNIQELQFISMNNLPINIIIINNHALGMIRHFQEMYFGNNYSCTVEGNGYGNPDFSKVAAAYNIDYIKIKDLKENPFDFTKPKIIELEIIGNTYISPKLQYRKPNQDQEPYIDRELFDYLMNL